MTYGLTWVLTYGKLLGYLNDSPHYNGLWIAVEIHNNSTVVSFCKACLRQHVAAKDKKVFLSKTQPLIDLVCCAHMTASVANNQQICQVADRIWSALQRKLDHINERVNEVSAIIQSAAQIGSRREDALNDEMYTLSRDLSDLYQDQSKKLREEQLRFMSIQRLTQ